MSAGLLQYLGAILAMAVGLNGLIRPLHMGRLVGLVPENKVGLAELRVLFGSFLVVLPIILIIKGESQFFEFYGAAALSAAIIKTGSALYDKCPWKIIRVGIATDIVLAFLLLSLDVHRVGHWLKMHMIKHPTKYRHQPGICRRLS